MSDLPPRRHRSRPRPDAARAIPRPAPSGSKPGSMWTATSENGGTWTIGVSSRSSSAMLSSPPETPRTSTLSPVSDHAVIHDRLFHPLFQVKEQPRSFVFRRHRYPRLERLWILPEIVTGYQGTFAPRASIFALNIRRRFGRRDGPKPHCSDPQRGRNCLRLETG